MIKTPILLIEDTDDIRFLTKIGLEQDGYHVVECSHAKSAIKELESGYQPHAILLDLMLPDENGIKLIPFIRKHTDAPIIIVTAKAELVEKVVGLEAGSDDYIVKPFQMQELLARVKAHVRRYTRSELERHKNRILKFSNWTMDTSKLQVFSAEGKNANLSIGEFHLLKIFISHPNRVFSREQLLDRTREDDFDITDRAIDTQIARIRKKLSDERKDTPYIIQSARGAGYFYGGKVEVIEE